MKFLYGAKEVELKRFVQKYPVSVLSILFLVFLPACWPADEEQKEQEAPKQTGLIVINVLSAKMYNDCHIAGSICVPFEAVEQYAQENIDQYAEIVLYCSNYMCSASGFARKKLMDLGFKNVLVYEGGTAEWIQLGYPVEGPCKLSYLKKKMEAPDELEPYVISAQELKKKMEKEELKKG